MKKYLFLFISLILSTAAAAQGLNSQIGRLTAGKEGMAVALYDLNNQRLVYQKNLRMPLKPASVMKLLTTYTALSVLGPEYRFETKVLSDGVSGGVVNNLYIVGGGDPNFTTESLWIIVRAVKKEGIKNIRNLVLDTSVYKNAAGRSGERAYEAANSGLPFNFNAVMFEICPQKIGQAAVIKSDPWEYAVAADGKIMTAASMGKGYDVSSLGSCSEQARYVFSGQIPQSEICTVLYRSIGCPEEYLAQVLRAFLRDLGINVENVRVGKAATSSKKIFGLQSKSLSQIVEDMNRFSNNFIAEQLLIALDSRPEKEREVALMRLESMAETLAADRSEFRVVDASGLSHDNRLSAALILNILRSAWNDFRISADFEKSLAVGGESGTLKTRDLKFSNAIVRGKTGTIDGVSAMAGYILKSDKKYAFVIMQNNGLSHSEKQRLEERIIQSVVNYQ